MTARARCLGAIVVACVLIADHAVLAGATPREQAWDFAHEIMSPFCPGMTLATCPSPAAADLRDEIARRFEAGDSRDAILPDLIARFGEGVRGTPVAAGPGALLWLLPGVLGLALLTGVIQVWRGRPAPVPVDPSPPAAAVRDGIEQRLEAELERLG